MHLIHASHVTISRHHHSSSSLKSIIKLSTGGGSGGGGSNEYHGSMLMKNMTHAALSHSMVRPLYLNNTRD